jgi:hypothetical protein
VREQRRIGALVVVVSALLAGCADQEQREEASSSPKSSAPASRESVTRCPRQAPYRPGREEEQSEIKRVAGRIAQGAVTYRRGTTPAVVAARLAAVGRREAVRTLAPAVDSSADSCGRVVYPQLSGLTETTAGVMVAVKQTLKYDGGRTRSHVRVIDVRLRRGTRGWRLDQIGSVGGKPVTRPSSLDSAAARVLDHPAITLTDSARWDIHRGDVDTVLLEALARMADRRSLSVLVLRSGHPPNVWATNRSSAHASGRAADIWAIQERPVIRQRGSDSPAHAAAGALLTGGVAQLGAPWDLGERSFTDPVHQDHLHLQQR